MDCLVRNIFYIFVICFVIYFLVFYSFFFFSSRRRHTRFDCDWSSDVCSSDLLLLVDPELAAGHRGRSGRWLRSVGSSGSSAAMSKSALIPPRSPSSAGTIGSIDRKSVV